VKAVKNLPFQPQNYRLTSPVRGRAVNIHRNLTHYRKWSLMATFYRRQYGSIFIQICLLGPTTYARYMLVSCNNFFIHN